MSDMDRYDAELLNDFGGGNVAWWHDYIRAELERSHEHYEAQNATLRASLAEVRERVEALEGLAYRHVDPMDATMEDAVLWATLPQVIANNRPSPQDTPKCCSFDNGHWLTPGNECRGHNSKPGDRWVEKPQATPLEPKSEVPKPCNHGVYGYCGKCATAKREPQAAAGKECEFKPHWWCERCQSEKSPVQVKFDESCTLCGENVEWRENPDGRGEGGAR